ncbi:MAG TPA: sodium:solute symporter family protein [Candidatus Acidoferrales bacterium]|nr:sodium:solute symporter family protein [Candidatus Acidoferrales bacterium]
MHTRLDLADWTVIASYLIFTLLQGLYFRRRSSRSTTDYFVSGRRAAWWLIGTSMVATTFGADTPLVVTGYVYTNGIVGNWIWWSLLPSGVMTVFLFARLWVRSGLLTDVEFAEVRYAGKRAAFLRGFRALYLGLLVNCIILGWVTKAMTTIAAVVLGVDQRAALAICIFFLIPFTGIYVALGGLWGVLWTDLFQFILKMAVVIAVAWYGVDAAGGMRALLAKLGGMQAAAGPGSSNITSFFPDFSRGLASEALWTIPVITFCVYLGVQWWAFWYPGSEPGGGGYVAQRILSARDERHGLLSVLWFNFAHYALRSWPWILAALAVVVLYPQLAHPESGYVLLAVDHLPRAARGLLVAGFLAAFMSTIATHLNWGSSYLVSDFYRRFIRRDAPERHYVAISRWVTILLVVLAAGVSWELVTIRSGWEVLLEVGAGTGSVYLLRWYWWRINAWSEIAAMSVALGVSLAIRWAAPFHGSEPAVFAKQTLVTTAITTVAWVVVTLLTPAEPRDTLVSFYRRVRPDAFGWRPIARLVSGVAPEHSLVRNLIDWIAGCAMIYCALFGIGKICLLRWRPGAILLAASVACAAFIYRRLAGKKSSLFDSERSSNPALCR